MKTQRSADIMSGGFLSVLGLVVILASLQIRGSSDIRLHPRTLPLVLGLTILVAGVILIINAWRFQEEGILIKWPDRAGTRRILLTMVSLAIYISLMFLIGVSITTFLFISFLIWYLGEYRIVVSLIIGLVSAATVYFLFIRLLEIPFPTGLFGW